MQRTKVVPPVEIYNYFTLSLDNYNQFKVEIHSNRTEKKGKKEAYFSVQKLSSNQNYNSFAKQILLQKSQEPYLTHKKQFSEEISQYIFDRDLVNKPITEQFENNVESLLQSPKSTKRLFINPLNNPQLEEQFRQKINLSHNKFDNGDQNEDDAKSEHEAENKDDDKAPKRGLTFISKKLSLLLRQKKRIKSSQLFSMPLSLEDNEKLEEQQPIKSDQISQSNKKTLSKQEKQDPDTKESKQRRNIRRRIYDSINVMVALGIIKKIKNQFIYIEEKDDINDEFSIIQQEEILNKKKDYLRKLQNDCQYKSQCLKYLTEAYAKMKILRKINSEYEDVSNFLNLKKLNSLNQNTSTQASSPGSQEKIEFPFILAETGNKKIKVQLINDSEQIEPRTKKLNDWTDYIEIENQMKQKEIEKIKIEGHNLKMISDLDCINLLASLETQQNAQNFEKHQSQILRDYEIISNHKQKKNEQVLKSFVKLDKE